MKKKITLKTVLLNFDAVITGATLTACVIIVNANVLMRYFFRAPLQWGDEIVTSLFVWTVFIGSAYAYRKHAHLGVDIVINHLRGKTKVVVADIMSVLELLVLIMLTVISAQYVFNLLYVRGVYKPYVTDMLRIPKFYTGIAVPIGFFLSTIYSVYFLLTDRFHIIKKKLPESAEKSEDEDVNGDGIVDFSEHNVEGGNF